MSKQGFFYNTKVGRPGEVRRREIFELLDADPLWLFLAEIPDLALKRHRGYVLVRDSRNAGRSNIGGYVRDDVIVRNPRWIDLNAQWPKTKAKGRHAPRSLWRASLEVPDLGRHAFGVVHAPPAVPGADRARAQHNSVVRASRQPWSRPGLTGKQRAQIERRPSLWVGDWNGTTEAIAAKGDEVLGRGPDRAVVRNIDARVTYPWPALGSDHEVMVVTYKEIA
jgi:hypothetical protein